MGNITEQTDNEKQRDGKGQREIPQEILMLDFKDGYLCKNKYCGLFIIQFYKQPHAMILSMHIINHCDCWHRDVFYLYCTNIMFF